MDRKDHLMRIHNSDLVYLFYLGLSWEIHRPLYEAYVKKAECNEDNLDILVSGSFAEGFYLPDVLHKTGTTSASMDLDRMLCFKGAHVTDINDLCANDSDVLYMEYTKSPVYMKLRLCSEKSEQFENSKFHKMLTSSQVGEYISSDAVVRNIKAEKMGQIRIGGPAMQIFASKDSEITFQMDFVIAIACPKWPRPAAKWCERTRKSKWPSQTLMHKIMSQGCHLVPVGNPQSTDIQLEWRLSFSKAEVKLARSLTESQRDSYLAFKTLVKRHLGCCCSALPSYYLKTVMFWACEDIPHLQWGLETTGARVLYLIDKLIHFVVSGYIPHYFITRYNLLGCAKETKSTLLQMLSYIRKNIPSCWVTSVGCIDKYVPFVDEHNFSKLCNIIIDSKPKSADEVSAIYNTFATIGTSAIMNHSSATKIALKYFTLAKKFCKKFTNQDVSLSAVFSGLADDMFADKDISSGIAFLKLMNQIQGNPIEIEALTLSNYIAMKVNIIKSDSSNDLLVSSYLEASLVLSSKENFHGSIVKQIEEMTWDCLQHNRLQLAKNLCVALSKDQTCGGLDEEQRLQRLLATIGHIALVQYMTQVPEEGDKTSHSHILDEARDNFENALWFDENHSTANLNLAFLSWNNGQLEEACQCLKLIVEHASTTDEVCLGKSYQILLPKDLHSELNAEGVSIPVVAMAYYLLVFLLLELNQRDEADVCFNNLVSICDANNPTNPNIIKQLLNSATDKMNM